MMNMPNNAPAKNAIIAQYHAIIRITPLTLNEHFNGESEHESVYARITANQIALVEIQYFRFALHTVLVKVDP